MLCAREAHGGCLELGRGIGRAPCLRLQPHLLSGRSPVCLRALHYGFLTGLINTLY